MSVLSKRWSATTSRSLEPTSPGAKSLDHYSLIRLHLTRRRQGQNYRPTVAFRKEVYRKIGELSRPRPVPLGRRSIAVRRPAQKGPSSIAGFDEKKRMTDPDARS